MSVSIPISIGELYDKYTILQIKMKKLKGDKLVFVQKEMDYLQNAVNVLWLVRKYHQKYQLLDLLIKYLIFL